MHGIFILIIASFFNVGSPGFHPVHVSVTNVVVNDDGLELHFRSFIDDWETAYYHYFGEQISLRKHDVFENEWFNAYFNASFKLGGGDGNIPINMEVDTVYFDDLAMTVEMHASVKNKLNSLYIYNSILTDIFGDQNNLFIISFKNKEKGIKFDALHKEEYLKLK